MTDAQIHERGEEIIRGGVKLLDADRPRRRCVDCKRAAVGLRPNLDREPTCLECEADRLATIVILLRAASGVEPGSQVTLFDEAGP